MNSVSLYLYRTELYNQWKNSDDCVTLEFEMWLIDRLVNTINENQTLKAQTEAMKVAVRVSWPAIPEEDLKYLNEVKPIIPKLWQSDETQK